MPEVKLLGKTLDLENPQAPTEQDIVTIKNTFKIPLEYFYIRPNTRML